MMYESKLAAAIKVAGKVLREVNKDHVYLPFGSEYSVYLKNMSSRRAVAHVIIDGTDVGDGRGFVVPANGTIDIERFINEGNLDAGNRFKFIERTGAVEEHRGVGIEDGLIQIRFKFEREVPKINPWFTCDSYNSGNIRGGNDLYGSPMRGMSKGPSSGDFMLGGGTNTTCSTKAFASSSADAQVNHVYTSHEVAPQNEAGITAPGSISDQQFSDAGYIPLEYTEHTMVFHLLGETEDNRAVREPVTVKHKPQCVTCGTINKFGAKFCSECGTSLQIV